MASQVYTSRVSSILLLILYYVLPLADAASIGVNGVPTQTAFSELAKREYDTGSSCSEEGQWNCMGSSWQRCAAGQWSSVVQCAPGTQCTPSGLSDDMDAENTTDSSSDPSSPGSTSGGEPTSGKTDTCTDTSTPRLTTGNTLETTGVSSTPTKTPTVSTPTAGVPGGYSGWKTWSLVGLVIAVLAG
ncbi:hypothetical protein PG994_010596 [Apiospora phragmitis]|uniref:Uncharacterized protein n=1 Tax=Apiospora phragmitis TaxID=2905665 RepID=A0ABR1TQC2_9PEZI